MPIENPDFHKLLQSMGYTEAELSGSFGASTDVFDESLKNDAGWSVEAEELKKHTHLVLNRGRMRFDMDIYPKASRLFWEAQLPEFLRPGQSPETYTQHFLKHTMHILPGFVYNKSTAVIETEMQYHTGSTVSLQVDGKKKEYSLTYDSKKTEFALDFLRPQGQVQSLEIHGVNSDRPAESYDLGVVYDEFENTGTITLQVPHVENCGNPWNERSLSWALDYHRFNPRLVYERVEAQRLHGVIYPYLQKFKFFRGDKKR